MRPTPWPSSASSRRTPQRRSGKRARHAKFDVARIDEIEAEVKHDVIAFLTHLSEIVGPEARFVHQGMTSSDVLDTCFNVQLVRAADILIADVDTLARRAQAPRNRAQDDADRSAARTASMPSRRRSALSSLMPMRNSSRASERLVAARKEVATCAISGAVGTFAQVDPRVEAHVAKAMGLAVEPVSTQIIPRDRHAMYFATLGVVASSIERLATEIRHLQRTEVLEAEEFFSEKQKGSSAMPHKRNPVLSENITGLARMVRAYALPAMENVALWHERDISHSSVERMIGPDATVTLDFALKRLAGIIDKLVVYPENMQKNLDRLGGLMHSQRVLIALTQKGVAREDAYRLVQRNAMKVWRGEGDFLALAQGRQGRAAKLLTRSSRPISTSAITSSTSTRSSSGCSAHDPEKWGPAFGRDHAHLKSHVTPCTTQPLISISSCFRVLAIPASSIGNLTGALRSATPPASCRTTGTTRRLNPG